QSAPPDTSTLSLHDALPILRWCRETNGFGRIFYRRRRIRLKRKSGNVADFCRRWGRKYRYMIMLDADSVMSGDTLARLVQRYLRDRKSTRLNSSHVAISYAV